MAQLIKLISVWYDDLDIRRMHKAEYRNLVINRLYHSIKETLAHTK